MHWTILLMLLSTAQKQNEQWEQFKTTYNKIYDSEGEESLRKQLFFKNLDQIDAHNERFKQGLETFQMKINEFSDKDEKEFLPEITLDSGLDYSLNSVDLAIQSLEEEAKKVELTSLWNEFKMTHRKIYKNEEEEMERIEIFQANIQDIEAHNKRYHKGLETFKMGINQFTDMSNEEFSNTYFHPMPPLNITSEDTEKSKNVDEKYSYMWYSKKIPVKDQKSCGSCWTFTVTGSLEYAYLLYKKKIYSLSEQEFLDCETQSSGCQGGYSYYAMQYAQQHGANFENEYPYENQKSSCRLKSHTPENIIKNVGMTQRSEQSIQRQLKWGPFKVSVCANGNAWQHYKSGILSPQDCNCGVNHAVVLIGAGGDESIYWIRNSWGTNWGYSGHIKLLMNQNTCHIADEGGVFIQV